MEEKLHKLTQKVDVSLAAWSLRQGSYRPLKLYLFFRYHAHMTGGYFVLTPSLRRKAKAVLGISESTFYRHLTYLQEAGWLTKGYRKWHFTSLYKICADLGLTGRAAVPMEYGMLSLKPREFKAYCLTVYIQKNIVYGNRNRKGDFGRESCTPDGMNTDLHVGTFAVSLVEDNLGVSKSEASRLLKIAGEKGWLEVRHQYQQQDGRDIVIPSDQVRFLKRAAPDLWSYLVEVGEEWKLRDCSQIICKLELTRKARRKKIRFLYWNSFSS